MRSADNLASALNQSVRESVGGLGDMGLIFSAGIDSTLVGYLASKHTKVRAYNVGFDSARDRIQAEEVSDRLPFEVKHVELSEDSVEAEIDKIVSVIAEPNPLKIAVAVPFYFASKRASEDGISVMLCGQGADELFGGYNRYLKTASENDPKALDAQLQKDVDELWDAQLRFDVAIARSNNVELRFPFLADDVKDFVKNVPIGEKIKEVTGKAEYGCVDEVDGRYFIRKYILRKVAEAENIPRSIIDRPKKAAQYGSGSEKLLKKIARKHGFSGRGTLRAYVDSFF